ncbi:MAG: TlpA disulfide reductase family protein, partial [Armatimonadetes bacterium]|nr:TlpA disulfide reductase family protein [Armatimonadota bacterium]
MKTLINVFAVGALLMAVGVANAAEAVTPTPAKLEVGSVPPPLKVFKWVKGKPVTKFEKGKIYVVEFWATWCPPCRTSIPHVTELAKKYAGKITFIGVSIWDSADRATRKPYTEDKYIENVTKFV